MGLDISAYRKMTAVAESVTPEEAEDSGYIRVFIHPDFPGRCPEFSEDAYYTAERMTGSGRFGFPYSYYSRWRDRLAALAGNPATMLFRYGVTEASHAKTVWDNPVPGSRFVELINFSDCEGWLGTAVCAKLAADFDHFQGSAREFGDDFFSVYEKFREAFHFASDGGAVRFH